MARPMFIQLKVMQLPLKIGKYTGNVDTSREPLNALFAFF